MVGSILAGGALLLLTLGGGALLVRAILEQQETSRERNTTFLQGIRGLFDSIRVAPESNSAPASPADKTEEQKPVVTNVPPLRWTQALIVLDNMPDPNNPALDAYNKKRREQEKLNSEVGQIYQGIRTALGMVPYVGPVFTVLANLFDLIGPSLVGDSRGGFQDLSLLGRQRMVLYRLDANVLRNSPFESQRYDRDAQRPEKPTNFQQTKVNLDAYDEKYRRWLRRYLVESAIKAEAFRVARTTDEAMLPAAVIDLLIESQLWPPPLEPMPLKQAEWKARRSDPAVGYPMDWTVIDLANPVTQKTYEFLRAEYERDARRFANAISVVQQPREVIELARRNGSIPQLGSPAAPLKTSGTREGGL